VGTRQTRWIYFRKKCKSYKSRWSLHRHYRKRNGFDAIEWILGSSKEKTKSKKLFPKWIFHGSKKIADKKFYLETKLKANEIELFLQFCEADPKSRTIAANDNTLRTMDFLFAKTRSLKARYFKIIYFSSLWTTDNYLFNHQILPFNTAAKLTH
jgi:hypothetical protein